MAIWPRTQLTWLPSREGASPLSLTIGDGLVSADGIVVQPGIKGMDAPAYKLNYTESSGIDGAHLNSIRVPTREMFIPFYVEGMDRGEFLTNKRKLLQAFNPILNGSGRLTVTEGDGSARYITALYFDGAEGDEGTTAAGFYWCKYGIRFLALDPYFYSDAIESVVFRGDATALVPFFSNPFLGLHLMETQSFNGAVTLTSNGDADSYPTWKIIGPATSVTFANLTSGQSFTLNRSLASGESVTITTEPGKKSAVLDSDGSNVWPQLGPNPQLWPIRPYDNEITLDVLGITSATEIHLDYRARYLSA